MASAEGRTRIALELEQPGDHIHGSVELDDGTKRPFSGWLELAGLLDELRGASTPAPTRGPLGAPEGSDLP